ncbi:MAG: 3'-5' exonuclease, partial [Candidatus Neomarinimicrobiota bacterium]
MNSGDLLKLLELDEFVVIDFETTGLDPNEDTIIEAAAVRFSEGQPVDEFQQLINPGRPIPRQIVELTNITDEMVSDQPTIEEVGNDFIQFVGSAPLVAQNISFDMGFLKTMRVRLELDEEVDNQLFDTLPLARTFLYHHPGFSLGALCEFFQLAHSGAHRAYNDALNTGHVFIKLVHEAASFPLPIIQELLGVQSHLELPNKALYVRLAQVMSSGGSVKGLTISQIERPTLQAVYETESPAETYTPLTPEE